MSFFTPFAFVKQASAATPAYDPDAAAFISATGISGTEANAINTLVLDLKSAGIYNKFNAIYPIVGSTANTQKYNLINPVDTDAGYRLTFVNSPTHDSNGVTFNGTDQYADTNFNPLAQWSAGAQYENCHLSIYNRTAGLIEGNFLAGKQDPTGNRRYMGIISTPTRVNISNMGDFFPSPAGVNYSSLQGFLLVNRSGNPNQQWYRNGTQFHLRTNMAIDTQPNCSLTLAARKNAGGITAGTYTAYNCAFATIGFNLDSTENANLYTAVQTYQTALGRQV